MNNMKHHMIMIGAVSFGLFGIAGANQAFCAPLENGAARVAIAQTPETQAREMLAKSAGYLKESQLPNGAFAIEQMPVGITALALKALSGSQIVDAKTAWVKKGYENLLSNQNAAGGIYKDQLANYNTAISISALAAANNPDYKPAIDKALAYLKSLQWTESIEGGPNGEGKITPDNAWYGGAGYGNHSRPDGSNTQMMLDALYDAGLKSDDPAYKAALKFVTRMQNLSETNDQKWAGNDGGAVYTPANNGESTAGEYTDANGKRLLRSYGSMTYSMLKSYVYAGLQKDDPRVKAAWKWVSSNWTLDENPGFSIGDPANAKYGLYYYYMTLARTLEVYDQPLITDAQGNKHDWRVELIKKLAELQKTDGSWVGEAKWQENNGVIVTSYCMIALEYALKDLKENPAK